MPLPYYRRLSRSQQAQYRQSDALAVPVLAAVDELRALALDVEAALDSGDPRTVGVAVRNMISGLIRDLGAPPVRVSVRSRRPANSEEELHGLYEPVDGDSLGTITVWMRTVAHGRVVRFRTFARTVLHELLHHLDYELWGLDESFHTEGFFQRESALMRQLVPKPAVEERSAIETPTPTPEPGAAQLSLPF